MNRSTREYEAVTAPPGGIIVNIGDVMQFWTSDTLVANVSSTKCYIEKINTSNLLYNCIL